jgi:hypothetical protein
MPPQGLLSGASKESEGAVSGRAPRRPARMVEMTERYVRPDWFTTHVFNRAVAWLTRR